MSNRKNGLPLRPGEVFGAYLFPDRFDRIAKTKSKNIKNKRKRFPVKKM